MRKLHIAIFAAGLAWLLAIPAFAATESAQAKVLKVSGGVTVMLPGQSEAVTPTVGMMLPEGTTITTSSGAELDVQTISGSQTTIRQNSSVSLDQLSVTRDDSGAVTKQTALVGLKAGNVISTLDPTKKAINNYGVRTPKGVAAARGTAYTVSFDIGSGTTSVATLSGTVTLTPVGGGTPIVIDLGTGVVLSGAGTSSGTVTIAELVAQEVNNNTAGNENSLSQALDATVQAVADAVQSGTVASADGATTLLASVVTVASQANPAKAASYTSTAVTAATSSTAATSGSTNTVNAIAEAAAQGAAKSGATVDTTAIVSAATNAAAKNNVTVNSSTLSGAVNTGATNGASSSGTSSGTGTGTGTGTTQTGTSTTVTPPTTPVTPPIFVPVSPN